VKRIFTAFVAVSALACAAAAAGEDTEEIEVFPGDPIVITAIGEPARESEVPFGINAISAEELRLSAAENLADGLVRAEGMYVRGYGGAGSTRTLATRGGYAKQTLVMVDGQPINNHQGGDVDFNAISLEDVERVEILAGPSSALYGANATAGVVNVITRGIPDEPGLSFRGDYGSFEDVGAEAGAALPLGPVGLAVGGNYRDYGGFRGNDDYRGAGGHAKLSYALGDEAVISLRGQYRTSELGVPGSLSYPSPLARQEDDLATANLGAAGPVSEAASADARLFYKMQKRYYVDADPTFPADDTHENRALGGRGAVFYQLLDWNRLAAGGEYEREMTESTVIGERDGATWAAFAQEDLRFGELTTVLGARYDSSGIYGDAVSPRLGARYRFGEYVSARASAGRGFRAPTFDELFWPDTGFGGGNPDLKPEYCWAYEAGPIFRFKNALKAELTYFYSDYEDLIGGWPPENVARASIQGLEAGIDAVPVPALPGLGTTASATYLATEDEDTGEKLDYRPEYTAFGEIRYRRDFGDAFAITPSVSAEFVGRQQYTDYDPITFDPFKAWLGAYALFNARLAFDVYYAELYVAAKNLGDKEYQAVYDYPMPGRTFQGGFFITF
jgi:outer membrane cobalamin receptor